MQNTPIEPLLDERRLGEMRRVLLGAGSADLIDFIFRLDTHQAVGDVDSASATTAIDLGLLEARENFTFTPLGWLVADAVREYRYWLDRNRRTHGEAHHELLAPERYAAKSVLETGSGFGCNLLSLTARAQGRFVGLEPVTVYRQLTPIFAEREGLPAPEVVGGRGEAIPFADAEFDIVLCYSAHQYMDIRPALREMARVLRPGGQLQIIGGTLGTFSSGYGGRLLHERRLGMLKHYLLTIGNTLTYECLGRRLVVPRGAGATSAPIYPRYSLMCQWIRGAGLSVREDLMRRIDTEMCFVADKLSPLK